jgi:xylan 1,4-beta-xylosidase
MVGRAVKMVFDQVKQSAAPDTPIFWTEYNATYLNQQQVTDSAFMGPWLANDIRECDGLSGMMSYWTFSDVFEEQGIVKTPFYGGYGIIAERGIPKPAFRAFELLHRLGDRRLPVDSDNALVTKRPDGALVVALWNYAEPDEQGHSVSFQLKVNGVKVSRYRMQLVDPDSGSGLHAWQNIGSPISPTLSQIQQLRQQSELSSMVEQKIEAPIVLRPQALAVLELR